MEMAILMGKDWERKQKSCGLWLSDDIGNDEWMKMTENQIDLKFWLVLARKKKKESENRYFNYREIKSILIFSILFQSWFFDKAISTELFCNPLSLSLSWKNQSFNVFFTKHIRRNDFEKFELQSNND